jgi:hypothetical protein
MRIGDGTFILLSIIALLSQGDVDALSNDFPAFLLNVGTINHRTLQQQLANDTAKCYSTLEESNPNR